MMTISGWKDGTAWEHGRMVDADLLLAVAAAAPGQRAVRRNGTLEWSTRMERATIVLGLPMPVPDVWCLAMFGYMWYDNSWQWRPDRWLGVRVTSKGPQNSCRIPEKDIFQKTASIHHDGWGSRHALLATGPLCRDTCRRPHATQCRRELKITSMSTRLLFKGPSGLAQMVGKGYVHRRGPWIE